MLLNLNIFIIATFFVLTISGESTIVQTRACDSNQFQCSDFKCIPKFYVCNGNPDCVDKEDERNCDILKCNDEERFFKCRDGGCISRKLICDEEGDCLDNSDESDELCPHVIPRVVEEKIGCNMTAEFECEPGVCIPIEDRCDGTKHCRNGNDEKNCKEIKVSCSGFLCSDGICLSSHAFVCDGTLDCSDGGDEKDCSPHCDLNNDKFLCNDNQECIDLSKVCDGKKDCTDGSDEDGKCLDKDSKDACEKLRCETKCKVLPNGPTCICEQGYKFNKMTDKCEDINECEDFGICPQKCNNTKGSYNCFCENGYRLGRDGKSCESSNPDDIYLVFTTKKYVKRIQMSTGYETLVAEARRPIGIAYDGDYYYWTEVSSGKEAIVKMRENSTKKEILFTNGLELPEDIAVDWLTKNIYFTDSARNHIAVCTNDGYYCTELIQIPEMQKIRAITLHPLESLIFWSDWGKNAHIGVSFMDGSQARIIVEDLLWPNGLTLDWPNGRIYWIDALHSKIESATIEGKDRRTVLTDVFKHPFAIAVHSNRLYWSDKGSSMIEYCDKFTGKHHDVLSRNPDVFDVHIFDKNSMPPKRHACINNRCSHICLLSKEDTYTCACPTNMILKPNNLECVISSQAYNLIFGIENYLVSTPHNVFGRHAQQTAQPLSKITAHKIAYNSAKGSVFVADNDRKIIVEYDFIDKMSTELVSKDISHVTAMSFDYHSNNLYWCDKIKNTIEVYSLNTKKRAIIQNYSGDQKIVSIVLVPSLGEMFVALQSNGHSHIDRQSMQGDLINDSHHHVIETDLSSIGNFYLTVDEPLRKIYWADVARRTIEYSNFDGTERRMVAFTPSRAPYTIALIGDELIWTSEKSKSLQSRRKDLVGDMKKFQIEMPETANSKSVINLISGSPLQDSANPCMRNNGGCSDICISNGPLDRICKCAIGNVFTDNNNKTCVPQKICDFKCGSGECIKADQICDGKADCTDKSDEDCKHVACRADQFKCDDGQCIESRLKCDGNYNCDDKSDEKSCEFKCAENQLQCKELKQCFNITQICDGRKECPNGSDESEEICKIPCPLNYFKCVSGQCIPKEFECDKKIDCFDASDEHDRCITNCQAPLKPCKDVFFCIDENYFCDGHYDCPDKSDEENCGPITNTTCDFNEFQCTSGDKKCIDLTNFCDGKSDCALGEDEKDCFKCAPHMFECKNGRCIKESQVCNGRNECLDFSDEINCDKVKVKPPVSETCAPNTYRCTDGTCIDFTLVCDGHDDCDSDESPICLTACSEAPCEQICKATPKGAICDCKPGYKLKSAADHDCVDIDECKTSNPCSQICINREGSFRCECNRGYELSLDRVTCKALGGDPKLYYIAYDEIRAFSDHSKETIKKHSFKISDLAVDVRRNKLIFSSEDVFFASNTITNETKNMENITTPKRFFYDWITENIYVVSRENYRNLIHVCNIDYKSCVLIKKFPHIETIQATGDIDPIERWLFLVKITSWFTSSTEIIKMRLDGSDMKEVDADKGIMALTVDVQTKKIFYTCESSQSLISINYDGTDKKTYVHQSKFFRKPVDITIFSSIAYILDQSNTQVVKCKLYDDYECQPIPGFQTANSIRAIMVHQVKQKEFKNTCEGHGCDEICVVADTGLKCLCSNDTEISYVCEERIIGSQASSSDDSSSLLWLWISMLLICVSALIVAAAYQIKKRRIFENHFRNINVSFRNNNVVSEFPENLLKSPSTPFAQQLPKAFGMIPKGFEVINNDHNENHFVKSNEMQNFSDEECLADVEFSTNHDQSEKLIN